MVWSLGCLTTFPTPGMDIFPFVCWALSGCPQPGKFMSFPSGKSSCINSLVIFSFPFPPFWLLELTLLGYYSFCLIPKFLTFLSPDFFLFYLLWDFFNLMFQLLCLKKLSPLILTSKDLSDSFIIPFYCIHYLFCRCKIFSYALWGY